MMQKFAAAGRFYLLLLLLALTLAGCDKPGQAAVETLGQEKTPPLLYYYDGVINTAGELLFSASSGKAYQILLDNQGRQRYVLETENRIDPEMRDEYDEPMLTGCTLRIYTTQGQLQREISVEAVGEVNSTVTFNFSPDGNLGKSRVLVNRLLTEGTIQLLDMEGNVVLNKQILAPDELENWYSAYPYAEIAGNFICVSYNIYGFGEEILQDTMFYQLDGQPLQIDEKYQYIYNMYDEYNNRYSDYYLANYEGPQGQNMHDLLNANGQVMLTGLGEIEHFADGLMVTSRGFERGLMDLQGNWIYQESQFADLED